MKYKHALKFTLFICLQILVNAHFAKGQNVATITNSTTTSFNFIENKGQWDVSDLYRAESFGSTAQFNKNRVVFSIANQNQLVACSELANEIEEAQAKHKNIPSKTIEVQHHAWAIEFAGANNNSNITTTNPTPYYYNYFLGNDSSKWASNVKAYNELIYNNAYKNIDIKFYQNNLHEIEYDIMLKPSAKASDIKIKFTGLQGLFLNDDGNLEAQTSLGTISFPKPYSYQLVNGKKIEIESSYTLTNENVLGFIVGNYNHDLPLIIDPVALRWAIYVSNASLSGTDGHNHGIDVDANGNIYVAGRTNAANFPTTLGAYTTTFNGSGLRGFVCKINPGNTINAVGNLDWCTYIGGTLNGTENIYALKLDNVNDVYITGLSTSSDYPVTLNAVQAAYSGNSGKLGGGDGVVSKLSNTGSALLSSTYLGGSDDEILNFIYVDNAKNIYVAGITESSNYPVSVSALSKTYSGNTDAIFSVLNNTVTSILYSTYYGGTGTEMFTCIRPSGNNELVISGSTTSSAGIATSGVYQDTYNGGLLESGMLVKFNATNYARVWGTYINPLDNSKEVNILSQQVDKNGDIYFGAITSGIDSSAITSGVYQSTYQGGFSDIYIGKLKSDGTKILAGTYVGGSNGESPLMGLNIDNFGNVFGLAYTNSTNIITTADALQPNNNGATDAMFFKLDASLSTMKYMSYWGGASNDSDPVGYDGIKFSDCKAYTALTTRSADAPTTKNAYNAIRTSTSVNEPALAVWNNPSDVDANAITGAETVCEGSLAKSPIVGSNANYIMSDIVRAGIISTHPSIGTVQFQWQKSIDGITFNDILGATTKDLSIAEMGILDTTTYYRRNIGLEVCSSNPIVVKTVINTNMPQIQTISTVCRKNTITLKAIGTINSVLNWVGPNQFSAQGTTQTILNADTLNTGTYSVTETVNGCTSKPNTIKLNIVNCAPIANNDTYTINTFPTYTNTVASNDTDPSNDSLTYSLVNGGTAINKGVLILNKNGTFSYTPNSNFNGSVSFTYVICDDGKPKPILCDTAKVTLTLLLDTFPIVSDDYLKYLPNILNSIDVLANDIFGDTIIITTVNLHPTKNATNIKTDASGDTISMDIPNEGTWFIDTITGMIHFKPLNNFNGIPKPINYTAKNKKGKISNIATVTPYGNNPPIANPDHYYIAAGTLLNANTILVNDFDNDAGQSITLIKAPIKNVVNGILNLNTNGTFTYLPNNNFSGTDTFIYKIEDSGNPTLSDTSIVFITVNNPPIAVADYDTTETNTTLNASTVLINDSDIDASQKITISTTPIKTVSNGTLQLNINGTYIYTPNNGYAGVDNFIYSICDNGVPQLCDTALVQIVVKPKFVVKPKIEVVKLVDSLVANKDGSFQVYYSLVVSNSHVALSKVQVIDDLNVAFNTADSFYVSSNVITTGNLVANTNYNGKTNVNLLNAEHSSLGVNASDTIKFSVNIISKSLLQLTNTAQASGRFNEIIALDTASVSVTSPQFILNDSNYLMYSTTNFVIPGIQDHPNNRIVIFNRWGNKVFEKEGYDNTWDGRNTSNLSTGNGLLPEGTYFYILELNNITNTKLQGYIYLKR